MSRTCLVLLMLLAGGGAWAESFYKWVDGNGVTHYSEQPPPAGNAKTIDVELAPAGPAPAASPSRKNTKAVVIYTAEWCGVCKTAKKYFREHSVAYTEYDVEKSAKGQADYRRMNGRGVPLIMVGGARMDGFSAARFEQMMQ